MLKQDVLTHFKTTTAVAQRLNVSQPVISKWGSVVPEKYALLFDKMQDCPLLYDTALYPDSVIRIQVA